MDTHYETVSEVEEQKLASADIRPIRSEQPLRLSRLWAFVQLLLGSLWLVPIVVLLWLNLSSFRIGPSASCLGGCKADPLATGNGRWAVGLDRNDHNTLGGLQLVAKALELWFLFVAISLVYKIAMLLASRDGGLPIGLLTSPVEFADPRALFEIFRAVLRSPGQHRLRERALPKLCLHLFVIFVVFMCVLVNLMGPAVAVLVLPTLQWVNLPRNAQHSFNASAVAKLPDGIVPGGEDQQIFPNCTSTNLDQGQYSCTFIPYAASLDSWDDEVIATDSNPMYYAQTAGLSPEGSVFFTINVTDSSKDVVWAPNRQILREISEDLNYFYEASQDLSSHPAYRAYNSSLTTVLKRKGPIFGMFGHAYIPENTTSIMVGDDQEVRCYGGYTTPSSEDDDYNKCVRIGTGWNHLNKKAGFHVAASLNSSSELANVTAYFSDTSAYYSETFNSGLLSPSCVVNGTVSSEDNCDWTSFFSSNTPDDSLNISTNILGIELSMPQEFPDQRIVFEFFIFEGFSNYSLDTSPQTNPMYLVELDDVPDTQRLETKPVDPDWFLAAWSADQDGFIANRSASFSLIRGLKATFGPYSFTNATLDDTGDNDYLNSTNTFLPSSTPISPVSNTLAPSTTVITTSSKATYLVNSATHLSVSTTAPTTTTATGPMSGGTVQQSRIKRQEATSAVADKAHTPETVEESPYLDDFYYENSDNEDDKVSDDLIAFVFYSQLQALSMVTFSKSNLTRDNKDTKDPQHPTLWYYARVHVWAYGTDSRTSKLGITVTILGGVCVLVSTILGIFSPRRQRTLTELLLAAVEHRYSGELDHAAGDDNLKARTRYRLHEDGHDDVIQYRPI